MRQRPQGLATFITTAASILIALVGFGFCYALFDGENKLHTGIEVAFSGLIMLGAVWFIAGIWGFWR